MRRILLLRLQIPDDSPVFIHTGLGGIIFEIDIIDHRLLIQCSAYMVYKILPAVRKMDREILKLPREPCGKSHNGQLEIHEVQEL